MAAHDDVIAKALAKLGARYQLGAEGPKVFDCSGLVYYVFNTTGHVGLIGGTRRLAAGYTRYASNNSWFTFDFSRARPGDLIVYGSNDVVHIAVYLGNNYIVSALVNPDGVSKTHYNRINVPFYGVIMVPYPEYGTRTSTDVYGGSGTGGDSGSGSTPDAPLIAIATQAPPTGGTPLAVSPSGTRVAFAWTQLAQQAGTTTIAVEFQFFPATVTDATVSSTPSLLIGQVTIDKQVSGTVIYTGLPTRTAMKLRARTKSANGNWGPYSSVDDAAALFATAFKPTVVNPYFQNVTTQSPALAASISSNDPADFVTGFEPEVYLDQVAGGAVLSMWTPGDIAVGGASTRAQVNYAGLQIQPGSTLRWHCRVYGRDGAQSDFTSDTQVKFQSVSGPTAMSPTDRNTLLLTLRPQLTVGNSVPFDRWQIIIKRGTTVILDTGVVITASTTSITYIVPDGILGFGDGADTDLTWSAAIRPTGNSALDPASPDYGLQIDTLPAATLGVAA